MDELPRDDETAEQYAQRIRRARWRRRFVIFGVIVAAVGVLTIYAALTAKPIAKVGDACGGPDHIECTGHAWCWTERGVCLEACAPRIDEHCPPGTSCEMFDTIGTSGSWNGGRAFACKPVR